MGATSRFTVNVPTRLLEAVDRKLVKGGETRSAVVRRLLEEAVFEVDEQEDVQRWIRSYQENPQTEEELGWAAEAQQKKSSAGQPGREWDEPTFFQTLEERNGLEASAAGRHIVQWAEDRGLRLWWGKGNLAAPKTKPPWHFSGP